MSHNGMSSVKLLAGSLATLKTPVFCC